MNLRISGGAARPATLVVAALVAALTLVCTQRAVAHVVVANAVVTILNVPGGASSAPITYLPPAGNPTLITVTNRSSNDNIRGLASFAVTWVNTAPQSVIWTGTSRSQGAIGGETTQGNIAMAGIGPGVTVATDNTGGNVNKFKIVNGSGIAADISILQVW